MPPAQRSSSVAALKTELPSRLTRTPPLERDGHTRLLTPRWPGLPYKLEGSWGAQNRRLRRASC